MHTWQVILVVMVSVNTLVNCYRLYLEMNRLSDAPKYLGGKNE